MVLKQCIFYDSKCYKKSSKVSGKPTGIVVHSTGANNKTLKRYVQPSKTDPNYDAIIADIGKNKYGNHWNKSNKTVAVHGFIGTNAAGKVCTYQVLPYDVCCWGVGKGKKGSYNYNPTARIQFEICEDNLKNEAYFNEVFTEAIEYCAYLCKEFGLTVDKISSHNESYKAGYGSNHSDCDHWLKKYGKNMDWFRDEVEKLLSGKTEKAEDNAFKPYRVRVTASSLNIRKGAGTNYGKNGAIKDKGVYTIVAESNGKGATRWGKLKSGAGWISLDYVKKV